MLERKRAALARGSRLDAGQAGPGGGGSVVRGNRRVEPESPLARTGLAALVNRIGADNLLQGRRLTFRPGRAGEIVQEVSGAGATPPKTALACAGGPFEEVAPGIFPCRKAGRLRGSVEVLPKDIRTPVYPAQRLCGPCRGPILRRHGSRLRGRLLLWYRLRRCEASSPNVSRAVGVPGASVMLATLQLDPGSTSWRR